MFTSDSHKVINVTFYKALIVVLNKQRKEFLASVVTMIDKRKEQHLGKLLLQLESMVKMNVIISGGKSKVKIDAISNMKQQCEGEGAKADVTSLQ